MKRGPRRVAASSSAAAASFERTLELDPENVAAHFNLDLIERQLGRPEKAAEPPREVPQVPSRRQRARSRDRHGARSKDAAADHAAEAIVIYDLQRPDAYQSPFARAARAAAAGG